MNVRSLAFVAAVGIFGAAMLTVPAADASTDDAVDGVVRLEAYHSQSRFMPKPGKAHDYRATMEPGFWSVVALRSPSTGDMDLELFADKAHTKSLGRSNFGTGVTDFLAVDRSLVRSRRSSRRRRPTAAAPVHRGVRPRHRHARDEPEDLHGGERGRRPRVGLEPVAGVTYTFVLDPADTTADGDLFLVGSTPGDPSTGVAAPDRRDSRSAPRRSRAGPRRSRSRPPCRTATASW